MQGAAPQAYQPLLESGFAGARDPGPVTSAADVAHAVWRAVTDPSTPMRLAAGKDAEAIATAIAPDSGSVKR